MKRSLVILISLSINLAYAATENGKSEPIAPSVGEAAGNILEPVGVLTNTFYDIFYIIGAAMIMGSVIRYKEYRQNPSETRLSQPIFLFLIGIVFIAVPLIAQYSSASTAASS